MTYNANVSEEVWKAYVKQGFDDLEQILDTTRPIGQQFYDGKHVWNHRMLREAEILKELHNNSIFDTLVNTSDSTSVDLQLESLKTWFLDVCEQCSGWIEFIQ